jgi:hypothetical protein
VQVSESVSEIEGELSSQFADGRRDAAIRPAGSDEVGRRIEPQNP